MDHSVDLRRQRILSGAWQLSDLLDMSAHSSVMLGALRNIRWSTREVIGRNLARRSLKREGLERLRIYLASQLDDAGELEAKLDAGQASPELKGELADLQGLLEQLLKQIAQRNGARG